VSVTQSRTENAISTIRRHHSRARENAVKRDYCDVCKMKNATITPFASLFFTGSNFRNRARSTRIRFRTSRVTLRVFAPPHRRKRFVDCRTSVRAISTGYETNPSSAGRVCRPTGAVLGFSRRSAGGFFVLSRDVRDALVCLARARTIRRGDNSLLPYPPAATK